MTHRRGWRLRQAVAMTLMVMMILPASLSMHPPQEEEEEKVEREVHVKVTRAMVEVSLKGDHAHSDEYGHARTRVDAEESHLKVTMDRRLYKFTLTPSSWLVSPGATVSRFGYLSQRENHQPLLPRPCLYLARPDPDNESGPSGTMSLCHRDGPRVLLMIEKEMAELVPRPRLSPELLTAQKRGEDSYTHVVKRHPLPGVIDQDCRSYDSCARSPFPIPDGVPDITQIMIDPTIEDVKRTNGGGGGGGGKDGPLTVELGIFLDEALLNTFSKFLVSEQEITDLVLGLINNVQALYRHPSLGRQVDFTITFMELQKKQPPTLKTHGGNRLGLLNSFCAYNKKKNDPNDASPKHWDIGVYLSGLNFFVMNNGVKEGVTMGLAYTGGVCEADRSCVINELGSVNYRGHPYPSAGALSSYVLAHELGHSLGLRHDGGSNACNTSGFIMAAGRGLRGATTWSSCAKDMIMKQQYVAEGAEGS